MEEETDNLVDSKLLNLPEDELSTPPQLLQHLFSSSVSLPSSTKIVKALSEYLEERTTTSDNGGAVEKYAVSDVIGRRSFGNASTSQTNLALEHKIPPSSSRTALEFSRDIKREVIPQFYFPQGRPATSELKKDCLDKIDNAFDCKIYGLDRNEFRYVTTEVCKLPFFLSSILFSKIVRDGSIKVTRDAFIQYWIHGNMLTLEKKTQIFNILKQPDRNYLTQADFLTALGELCGIHPGLQSLKSSPDDLEAYGETVLYRIFYYNSRSGNDRITLRELKRGDLIAAMEHADQEAKINKVRRYFSRKHALVIRWNFMDLDSDNDMLIDKTDLAHYNNNALTNRILDRIFSQVPRRFKSKTEGKMCYEDFVYFILAEEDKQSEPSLEYWFKCIDLDGNGILREDELKYFYEEQFERMKGKGGDEKNCIPFDSAMKQIIDMIQPKRKDGIRLRDVKASKFPGDFFNILFNLNKSRQASVWPKERPDDQKKNFGEWDVFAAREYQKYSMEHDSDSEDDSYFIAGLF